MHGRKRYVDVVARWQADGSVVPLIVCWPDGRSFQIEEVMGKPQSSTFPGSGGRVLRYSVLIDAGNGARKRTQVFLEHGPDGGRDDARWYVEVSESHGDIWKVCSSTAVRP